MLASAGSGVATLALPDSAGVSRDAAAETLVLPYNDLAAVEAAFAERGEQIACVITEACPGNMGIVPPRDGLPPGQRGRAMIAVLMGVALATLDTAIANTALPTIAADLGVDPGASIWIVNAYQLAVVATLLPIAALASWSAGARWRSLAAGRRASMRSISAVS